jgi:hypothetical protein
LLACLTLSVDNTVWKRRIVNRIKCVILYSNNERFCSFRTLICS